MRAFEGRAVKPNYNASLKKANLTEGKANGKRRKKKREKKENELKRRYNESSMQKNVLLHYSTVNRVT